MRHIAAIALLVTLSAPAASAQDDEPPSLMERGAQMFLEGLMKEMGPAIDGMQDFVREMGPALRDLMEEVKDWSVYHAPEMLPNGDIIIRRKDPSETPDMDAPSIEL